MNRRYQSKSELISTKKPTASKTTKPATVRKPSEKDLRGRIEELERNMRKTKIEKVSAQTLTVANKENKINQIETLKGRLKDLEALLHSKEELCSAQNLELAILATERDETSRQLAIDKLEYEKEQSKNLQIEGISTTQIREIEECDIELTENEGDRRRLHNMVQELKGNIQVYCRVGPLPVSGESPVGWVDPKHVAVVNNTPLSEVSADTQRSRLDKSRLMFAFDHVFSHTSDQASVFAEVKDIVQSAVDGYNVCIFAYGQTGSGKTYTMEGVGEDSSLIGVTPRAFAYIFDSVENLRKIGWEYEMAVSAVEIYNEEVIDLLSCRSGGRSDNARGTHVKINGSDVIRVTSQHQISELLKRAQYARAVGETQCNAQSSRSHCIFELRLDGRRPGQSSAGSLTLVDLAGSERLNQSGAAGERLRETKAINRSLSELGNVIMAIGKRSKHIPFRNSKLTRILQPSLGGNSKTLMFVNISSHLANLNETISSLRFAAKVNQCHIGVAHKV